MIKTISAKKLTNCCRGVGLLIPLLKLGRGDLLGISPYSNGDHDQGILTTDPFIEYIQ